MARRYLTAFAWYEEDNALHIDVSVMLRELGVVDTPDNRRELIDLVARECAKYWKLAAVAVVEDE